MIAPADPRARARARQEWQQLSGRLATVTPRAAARYALGAGVITGIVWLSVASWPALLPFAVGAGMAYLVYPLVNWLDTFLPRALASIVAVLLTLAVVIGGFLVVLPVLARAVVQFATELPTPDELQGAIARLQATAGGLPPGASDFAANVLSQISTQLRGGLDGASQQLAGLALTGVRALVGVVAVALGLIALPTWILTVLGDRGAVRRAVMDRTTPWLRSDLSAVIRILDRAGRNYVRGALGVAVLVGFLVYGGLVAAQRLGIPAFVNAAPIATFAGLVQVIPAIGLYLGFLPALLIAVVSPERAGAYLVVYALAAWLGGSMIGSRLAGQRLHPAFLVPGIVALSQFGFGWLLLAGPVLAVVHDLIRYTHGRLSDPPRPAGVIPDEAAQTAPARPVPVAVASTYALRRSR